MFCWFSHSHSPLFSLYLLVLSWLFLLSSSSSTSSSSSSSVRPVLPPTALSEISARENPSSVSHESGKCPRTCAGGFDSMNDGTKGMGRHCYNLDGQLWEISWRWIWNGGREGEGEGEEEGGETRRVVIQPPTEIEIPSEIKRENVSVFFSFFLYYYGYSLFW